METTYRTGKAASADNVAAERLVLDLIGAIRELYSRHFDNGWFVTILERHAFNRVYLHDIRRLIELTNLYPAECHRLRDGIRALTEFIYFCRRCILPVLRDELGISGFEYPAAGRDNGTVKVVKGFFAYTFPANLERLAQLTDYLRESTEDLTQAG